MGSDHDSTQPNDGHRGQRPDDAKASAARLKDLLAEALDLPETDRHAFLANACGTDRELFNEAESLLRAAQASGFLKSPTASFVADLPPSESAGGKIGPYKLLQQIGEGGFGAVFMAEQTEPIRRRVALKVIKLGMDTRQVVARFEQERQALAVMDHPNIAKVFDAGATESGRPYFVMELFKGQPITEYCDRQGPSIPERLELFSQVCHAVQHAHTKGVIHRDIKPRNVLVSTHDGKPLVKVIDFGIAKATDQRMTEKTLFTEHQAMIGTPEYMSPEQAEGSLDIDTRTDVYSLGVLLYELLTGATPFDGKSLREAGYGEICRIIREVDPPRPSLRVSTKAQAAWASGAPSSAKSSTPQQIASVRRTEPGQLFGILKGDLDWVVMKALEKDRARRYATPTTLAEDVARYLAGEAVTAVPPSRWYRVRKFVRRNRTGVVAGAVVAGTLFVTIAALASAKRLADEVASQQEASDRARRGEDVSRLSAAVNSARDAIRNGRAEQARSSLELAATLGGQFELDVVTAELEEAPIPVGQEIHEPLGFSTGGEYLLVRVNDEIRVIETGERSVRMTLQLPAERENTAATYAVDHSRIMATDGSWVRIWDAMTGELLGTTPGEEHRITNPVVAVTGRAMAWIDDMGWAVLQRAISESGWFAPVRLCPEVESVAFSSTGALLIAVDREARSHVWSVSEPSEAWRAQLPQRSREKERLTIQEAGSVVAAVGEGSRGPGNLISLLTGEMLPGTSYERFQSVLPDGSVLANRSEWWGSSARFDPESRQWSKEQPGQANSRMVSRDVATGATIDGDVAWPSFSTVTGQWSRLPVMRNVASLTDPSGVVALVLGEQITTWSICAARPCNGADEPLDHEFQHLSTYAAETASSRRRGVRSIAYDSTSRSLLTLHPDALLTFDPMRIDRFPASGVISNVLLGAASADGERLIAINQNSLQLIDADGLHERLRVDHSGATTRAVALNATGELLAILDASGDLSLRSALDNTLLARGSVSAEFASASPRCAIGSDGSIAVANGRGDVAVFTRANSQLTEHTRTSVSGGAVTAIVAVPVRKEFLVGMKDGSTHVVDEASLAVRVTLPTNGHAIGAMTPSFDGLRYFTASDDGSIRIWHSETGKELLTLNEERITAAPTAIFIEPNNERLVVGYANGAERVWDAVTWAERVRRRGKPEWPNTEPKLVPMGSRAGQ